MSVSEIDIVAGLDPAIHQLRTSSTVVSMDPRVQPAHDRREGRQPMRNLNSGEII